ncbi:MAG: SPOR domain-containing protein [Azoarcus sp.]|nr:SPOR domain-containing protein [Azoarcus sp.]
MSDFPASDADDLEIRKRARRRLVGAVILALAAIIVLPMVLKNEVPYTAPDVQVSVPGRGESLQTVPGVDAGAANIEPDAALDVPGVRIDTIPAVPAVAPLPPVTALVPEPPAVPEPVPQVAVPPPPMPPVGQPSGSSRRETVPSPQSQPKPQPPQLEPQRPSGKNDDAARALALLNGAPPSNETAHPANAKDKRTVFVQVGAFGDAARAEALAKELNKQNFAARAEKVGKVTRVRIGPLPKSEAEQVVARLKSRGRNAVVTSR